ncbi:hypothetical protein DFH28DRAFT_1128328 [Melampsora americana]|nr:hypothetical protein DFH28DRAFT_1128328 [Melampsora americana]
MDLFNKKSCQTIALMLNWPILLTSMGVWDLSRGIRDHVPTSLASNPEQWPRLMEPLDPALQNAGVSLSKQETSSILFNTPGPSTELTSNIPAKPTGHISPIDNMDTGPYQPGAHGKNSLSSVHSFRPGDSGIVKTRNRLLVDGWSVAKSGEHPPMHQEVREETQSHVARPGSQIPWRDTYVLKPPSSTACMDVSGEKSWEDFLEPLDNAGYYGELSHVIGQLPGIMEDLQSWHSRVVGLPSPGPKVTSFKPHHEWEIVKVQERPSVLTRPPRSSDMTKKGSLDHEHAYHRELSHDDSSEELSSPASESASEAYKPSASSNGHTSSQADDSSRSKGLSMVSPGRSSLASSSDSHGESPEESPSRFLDSGSWTSSLLDGLLNVCETRTKIKIPDNSVSSDYIGREKMEVKPIWANSVQQNLDQDMHSMSPQNTVSPAQDAGVSLSRPSSKVDLQSSKRTYHREPFSSNEDDKSLHRAKRFCQPMTMQPEISIMESFTFPSGQTSWLQSKPRLSRGSDSGKKSVMKSGEPQIGASESTFDLQRYYSKKKAIERSYARSRTLEKLEKVSLKFPSLDRSRQIRGTNPVNDFERNTVSKNQLNLHFLHEKFPVKVTNPSGPINKGTMIDPRMKVISRRPEGSSYVDEDLGQRMVSNSKKLPLSPRDLIDEYEPTIRKFLKSLEAGEKNKEFAKYLVENMEKLWDNYLEMITLSSQLISKSQKTDMRQDLIDAYKWIAPQWKDIPGTSFDWLPIPGLKCTGGRLSKHDAFTEKFEVLSVHEGTVYWLGHRMYDRRRERVAGMYALNFIHEKRPDWIGVLKPPSTEKFYIRTFLLKIQSNRRLKYPSRRP